MKNKKILIILILITSSLIIGCSNSISSEDKVIDSVVIDEDAKETANSNSVININKIAITENLIDKNGVILRDGERLIEIQYTEDFGEGEGTIYQSQFPKLYISSLSIGTITDEIQDNRNIVNWENKDINGRKTVDYFEEKFDDQLSFMNIRKSTQVPTETILFNMDVESMHKKEDTAVLRVFTKVFYDHI